MSAPREVRSTPGATNDDVLSWFACMKISVCRERSIRFPFQVLDQRSLFTKQRKSQRSANGTPLYLLIVAVGPYFAVKGLNFFRYFAGKGAKFRENIEISLKFRNFLRAHMRSVPFGAQVVRKNSLNFR